MLGAVSATAETAVPMTATEVVAGVSASMKPALLERDEIFIGSNADRKCSVRQAFIIFNPVYHSNHIPCHRLPLAQPNHFASEKNLRNSPRGG